MIRIDAGTEPLLVALTAAARRLDDLTPMMDLIGLEMVKRTDQNFLTSTAPDGTPWAARSQTTWEAYDAAEPPKVPVGGPLRLKDRMRKSIAYEAGSNSVEWGSNAIQAAVMQFGAERGAFGAHVGKGQYGQDVFVTLPWGDIPARPFVGVGPDDEVAILTTVAEYLEKLLPG